MSTATAGGLIILRLSALGDVLHTLPAALAIQRTYGGRIPLGWVVESPFRGLIEHAAPDIRIFDVRTKRWRQRPLAPATWQEGRALIRSLRGFASGGISVDFQGLMKSGVIARVSGAEKRYTFGPRQIRERPALLFANMPVAVPGSMHVVELNLALARAVGAIIDPAPEPDLRSFPEDPVGSLQALTGPDLVLINPGAGNARKLWGAERWSAVAREIGARRRVMITWGPGEEPLAREIAEAGGAVLAPATTIRELAFLLRGAGLVLASDTGPLHLAAALGTRVVGLYGPTDPRRNGPWGQLDHCVETFTGSRRMSAIPVRSVLERVAEVIE